MAITSRIISFNSADKADVVAVLGAAGNLRMDDGFTHDIQVLIEKLDAEHESWEYGTKAGGPDAVSARSCPPCPVPPRAPARIQHRSLRHVDTRTMPTSDFIAI
ncbi:hypothetical protein [Streptomyces sp. GS7]|uniref:hypothetical protein n=1 Tax=Streptomyces sp. GS7 TaxID=2692234 RepID=UPI0019163EE4|nr:hypothetical protein [Streptomyces sp. GS7]